MSKNRFETFTLQAFTQTKKRGLGKTIQSNTFVYIIDNEPSPSIGDYCYEELGGTVYGPLDENSIVLNPRKIIASNDPQLGLPLIKDKRVLETLCKDDSVIKDVIISVSSEVTVVFETSLSSNIRIICNKTIDVNITDNGLVYDTLTQQYRMQKYGEVLRSSQWLMNLSIVQYYTDPGFEGHIISNNPINTDSPNYKILASTDDIGCPKIHRTFLKVFCENLDMVVWAVQPNYLNECNISFRKSYDLSNTKTKILIDLWNEWLQTSPDLSEWETALLKPHIGFSEEEILTILANENLEKFVEKMVVIEPELIAIFRNLHKLGLDHFITERAEVFQIEEVLPKGTSTIFYKPSCDLEKIRSISNRTIQYIGFPIWKDWHAASIM